MSTRIRQPAEWEPHDACWLAWPSHRDLWGEAIEEVRRGYTQMCRAILDPDPVTGLHRGERLEILVLDEQGEQDAKDALAGLTGIRFHHLPFGDVWLRDTAPIFVDHGDGGLVAVTYRFNGWGGKYRLPGDDELAGRICSLSGARRLAFDMVGEGGALESDGEGTCITTRQCLLNENRNPGMSEAEVEEVLRESLGITTVIWLDEGLANDHTDGHVDNLVRFIGPGKVACMVPSSSDPNRRVLEAIRGILGRSVDAAGRRLEPVELPTPGPVRREDGEVMPASYMNFYIANRSVIVPFYGGAEDSTAARIIQDCFPGRRVFGIDAGALLEGGGAYHCVTQQQPVLRSVGTKEVR